MTEKRFKEIVSTQKVIDNRTGREYDCLLDNDLLDLINHIAEENKRLKHDATVLICSNQEYRKENEQLKKEKEELLDKLLECQKALSRKRTKEEPHWHKYGNNEGYTAKSNVDMRFGGDVE